MVSGLTAVSMGDFFGFRRFGHLTAIAGGTVWKVDVAASWANPVHWGGGLRRSGFGATIACVTVGIIEVFALGANPVSRLI